MPKVITFTREPGFPVGCLWVILLCGIAWTYYGPGAAVLVFLGSIRFTMAD